MTREKMNSSYTTALVQGKREHTYEVVVHCVFDVVLWNGIFSVDNLQFGSILEWVLLKTQQVEDASKGLRRWEGHTDSGKETMRDSPETKGTEKLWPRCPVSHWWGSWSKGRSSPGFDTLEWCFLWSTQKQKQRKIKLLQKILSKEGQELVNPEVMTSEVIFGKPPVCVYGRNIIDLNDQCFLHVSLLIQSKVSGSCSPPWRLAATAPEKRGCGSLADTHGESNPRYSLQNISWLY